MSSFTEIPTPRPKDLSPLFAKRKHVRPSVDAVLRGHSGQAPNPPTGRVADRPPDWQTGQPANRRTAEPANRPTGQPANQLTGRPANRRTGQPANRPTCEPANWPTGRPADWLTGRLADRPTGRLADPHHIHSSTASLGFRAWSGTVASGAGYPTGKRTSGRSLSGLSRMLDRNAMGAAV